MRGFIYTMLMFVVLAMPAEALPAARFKPQNFSTSEGCLPNQLKNALSYLRKNYGKVTIISSYRKGARIAGTNHESKHARCQAVDFYVQNQEKARQWLWKQPLEVIAYNTRQFHHLHIAIGNYKGWKTDRKRRRTALPSYKTLANAH